MTFETFTELNDIHNPNHENAIAFYQNNQNNPNTITHMPDPSIIPAPMAKGFFSAPPSSTPITSWEV